MITAQDVKEKAFHKATLGGYNMAEVDEFLDELAEEMEGKEKENTDLKKKLRVLAEKVDEYRQTEESMRLALLSAQKMSAEIEAEARQRAEGIVAEAEKKAGELTQNAAAGLESEEKKLDEAQKATQRFIDHMKTVCSRQLEFYEKLADLKLAPVAEEPAPEAEEPAPEEQPEEEQTRPFAAKTAGRRSYDDFDFEAED